MAQAPSLPPEMIRARLQQIERERTALIQLLEIYDGGGNRTNGAASAHHSAPRAPVPHRRTVAFPSANGTTPAILDTVKQNPGIKKGELVERVLAQITPTAADPRGNIKSILRYQVKSGKLHKRGESYYPVDH